MKALKKKKIIILKCRPVGLQKVFYKWIKDLFVIRALILHRSFPGQLRIPKKLHTMGFTQTTYPRGLVMTKSQSEVNYFPVVGPWHSLFEFQSTFPHSSLWSEAAQAKYRGESNKYHNGAGHGTLVILCIVFLRLAAFVPWPLSYKS